VTAADLIAFEQIGFSGGFPVYTYVNAARATTAGLNLSAAVKGGGNQVALSYQFLPIAHDTSRCADENPYFCTEDDGATRLPLRPMHVAQANAQITVPGTGTVVFARAGFRSATESTDGLLAPGGLLLAMGMTQKLFSNFDFTLNAENLLDVTDPRFGPKPGRYIQGSIRASF
jgi:hypothetical protein